MTTFYQRKTIVKRRGNVSIKKKREKEKESHKKTKTKTKKTKKKFKRNSSLEGRSSFLP